MREILRVDIELIISTALSKLGSIEVKPPPMHRVAYIQITKFRV